MRWSCRAGTRLFHGIDLGDGDRPEDLPYDRTGYAVAAYSLGGALGDRASGQQVVQAAQSFRAADAGLATHADAGITGGLIVYRSLRAIGPALLLGGTLSAVVFPSAYAKDQRPTGPTPAPQSHPQLPQPHPDRHEHWGRWLARLQLRMFP